MNDNQGKEFFKEIRNEIREAGAKVNRLFEEWTNKEKEKGEFTAHADVYEDERGLVFELDLPGFLKENVKVQIRDQNLVIRGKRSFEGMDNAQSVHVRERLAGPFEREFELPEGVDTSRIKARFQNGVLTVSMPTDYVQYEDDSITIE